MSYLYLPISHYAQREAAIPMLAHHLAHGSLALVLGSGASRGLGLPSWPELVRRCLAGAPHAKIDPSSIPEDATAEWLMRVMDPVKDGMADDEFRKLVRNALYQGVPLDFS